MIQVMVIEDEPPILRSICNKIKEINSKFTVTHTACNGREAIEKLKMYNDIDLIIVDINLPVLNGITVLNYVKQNKPDILSIVLSGYKDFEYVRDAFENNTVDYLVKPLKTEELKISLQKIEKKFIEKNFYEDGKRLEEALKGSLEIQAHKEERGYHMMLITVGNYQNIFLGSSSEYESIFQDIKLKEILNKYLGSSFFWLVHGEKPMEKIAFIRSESSFCLNTFGTIFQKIQSKKIPITVTVNKTPVSVYKVYEMYYQMKKYLEINMIFCRASFLIYDGCQIENMLTEYNKKVEEAALNCKRKPEIPVIYEELLTILSDCIKKPTKLIIVEYIVKRYFFILCNCLPSDKEYIQLEEQIEFIVKSYYNLKDLEKELFFLIKECFGNVKIDVKDKKQLADEIKNYLETNYRFSITNQRISEKFGFVPSYLSSIFKDYYKLSLSDYIIMLRIKEAQELLKYKRLKIKDISEQVGYSDPLYFSKVFKKVVGMSPKEYINNLRNYLE